MTILQTPYPDEKAGGFTYNDSTFDPIFYNSYLNYNQFVTFTRNLVCDFEADFANLFYFKKGGRFAKHPLESQ